MSDKPEPEYNYLLPPEECERVYRILGDKPDLDPCGHPDQFMEAYLVLYGDPPDGDGMALKWADKAKTVWLNPVNGDKKPKEEPNFQWHPFTKWLMKATLEMQRGVTVLALLPASTDRRWFHQYVSEAQIIVLLESRVKSFKPNERFGEPPVRAPQPKTAHQYAMWTKDKDAVERFYAEMKDRGMVVEPSPLP